MKNIFFIIAIGAVFFKSYGQNNDSFECAVVEIKKAEYTIVSLNVATLNFEYRVKILSAKGEKYGNIEIPVDNNAHLVDFKGNIFDSKGGKIRKISKSELYTVSDFDNYSLYSDNKVKKADIHHFEYPYSVEYEFEIEYNGFLGCYFTLLDDYNLAAKWVELTVKAPSKMGINFKTNYFYGTHDTLTIGNVKTNTWRAENVKSIPKEAFSSGFIDLIPSVLISPTEFIYEGYWGWNNSWENYGKWIWGLLKDRSALPIETNAKIHQLTDSISDTISKIKSVYKYFQQSTRYISIQKGIGGFQPVSAATVDKCRYGDCKALSNYLRSLLSILGVEALYTEIGNGKDRKIKWDDFPSVYQTNHVILSVPVSGDTIWLECTNSNVPFGYIGSGNSDRKAVCINQTGGKIVNTPKYGVKDNYQVTKATIVLENTGNAKCNAATTQSGILMDNLIYLKDLDTKNQEKWITAQYPSVNLEIENFRISETEDIFPKMMFDIKMNEFSFLSKTGNYYTFKPNYLNRNTTTLSFAEKRENDIFFQDSFMMADTIRFILPENFKPEYLPEVKSFKSVFGKYDAGYYFENNELLYIRNFMFNAGTFAKEKYTEFTDFLNNVQNADNQIVILKNE